ncbi:toll-like receptor 4 [Crassostrea angulata]|uniref:toll-like receptor 4 n=1 Tax=Magallana angulata TaxID=2784310 RepID=UPI0022B17B8C|nr:toll-like receptor 4 [Crassostrea angulata]XP_052709799.1 toll-like receptor 4 [Crassostrea angulata]XP_052709800.1 toll-like receptor 4 [Crassostrea angulata]XP_052709801.1 toll-like receptor 4 [Crassostrea angulata]
MMSGHNTKSMKYTHRCISLLLVIYSVFLVMTESCRISHYTDDCGNKGLLWNCSGFNISKLPTLLPPELKNRSITLDLSFNHFSLLTEYTFRQVATYSNVTSVILNHNKITRIENRTFQKLTSLCSLDLSFANLEKNQIDSNVFYKLDELHVLLIHQNNFQRLGYPDIQLSKLPSLKHLKIDLFFGFAFTKPFENLTSLSQLEFEILSDFKLTSTSFQGLNRSPINSLIMYFKDHVDCDVSEDLFCSFPYLNQEIQINFGGRCSVHVALRSLKCLQNREIQQLDLSGNKETFESDIIIIDDTLFEYLVNICVRELYLGNNDIIYLKADIYRTTLWACLNTISLNYNDIQHVDLNAIFAFFTCPLLQSMDVCCNTQSPRIAVNNSTYLLKQMHPFFKLYLPKNLKVFNYSYNFIHDAHEWPLQVEVFGKSMEELYLIKTNVPLMLKGIFNFPSLSFLDLSKNDFANIHPDIFQGVKNLQQLHAVDVNLDFTNNLISDRLFKNLKHLTKLDISKNRLTFLPSFLLKDQKNSLTEINLDHNMFSALSNSLVELQNLNTLYVRYNSISRISEKDQKYFKSFKNFSIYLEGNPISCTCLNGQSLRWMKNHQYIFSDLPGLLCIESKTAIVELFSENMWRKFELDCQTTEWLIFSVGLLVLTLLTLIIIAVINKYRVHLEYVVLRIKQRWKGVYLPTQGDVFLHDVYVSYCDEDLFWITDSLYPRLQILNLKAWFKEKDSIPGGWVSEEIVNCINDSRKVIFIVSKGFLDKGWQSYAVQMTITHAFRNQRQKSIVVIIKDGLPLERLPKEFKHIWWCIEHLRWPEDDTNDDMILSKLSNVLKTE